MLSIIITFLAGALFAGAISYFAQSMINQAKVPDMIKAETEKRIKDLEFDNSFLKKKLIIANREHNKTIEERNKFAKDFNDKLKGL